MDLFAALHHENFTVRDFELCLNLSYSGRHFDASKHLRDRYQRLIEGHVENPCQVPLNKHRRVADTVLKCQFLRAQAIDQVITRQLKFLPECGLKILCEVQRWPRAQRIGVQLSASIESTANVLETTRARQWFQAVLVGHNSNPSRQRYCRWGNALERGNQVGTKSASFRFKTKIQNILKFIEIT